MKGKFPQDISLPAEYAFSIESMVYHTLSWSKINETKIGSVPWNRGCLYDGGHPPICIGAIGMNYSFNFGALCRLSALSELLAHSIQVFPLLPNPRFYFLRFPFFLQSRDGCSFLFSALSPLGFDLFLYSSLDLFIFSFKEHKSSHSLVSWAWLS